MSKEYTTVSQKRPSKSIYSTLVAASATLGMAFSVQAADNQQANQPAYQPTQTAASAISPDTSILSGCTVEDLKQANRQEWIVKNSYDFLKRNMTVQKSEEINKKIKELGVLVYMQNDPEAKKSYLEQVGIRNEVIKVQGEIYKCLQGNILKIPQSEIVRKLDEKTPEVVTSYPLKTLALKMALQNEMAALTSNVNNYGKDCSEKEPKSLLFIDSAACETKFKRMTDAQTMLLPLAQATADLGAYSEGDNKVFEKTLKTITKSQEMLEKEKRGDGPATSNTGATAAAPAAKPTVN